MKGDWVAILRDTAIVFSLVFIGDLIVIRYTYDNGNYSIKAFALTNISLSIIGFFIIGCLKRTDRFKRILSVAFIVWLLSLLNVFLKYITLHTWLILIVPTVILATLGGMLSYFLIKDPGDQFADRDRPDD